MFAELPIISASHAQDKNVESFTRWANSEGNLFKRPRQKIDTAVPPSYYAPYPCPSSSSVYSKPNFPRGGSLAEVPCLQAGPYDFYRRNSYQDPRNFGSEEWYVQRIWLDGRCFSFRTPALEAAHGKSMCGQGVMYRECKVNAGPGVCAPCGFETGNGGCAICSVNPLFPPPPANAQPRVACPP